MASFMGRAGAAGASAAVARALSPLRIGGTNSSSGSRKSSPNELTRHHSGRHHLSMARLRALEQELATMLDAVGAPDNFKLSAETRAKQDARLVEVVRAIAELVAFGEAGEDSEFFEFFCEKAVMASFVRALRLGPAVQTQVVQAISILFQNLQNPTSLYMLLSQDHINRLIEPEAGSAELPMHDEEFLSNYVALLKAISVRLSKDTVQFFLNVEKSSFPLFSRTVPLIAHADPMVRTSALNIILHVFSVEDAGVRAFLALEENYGAFFSELFLLMQDAYSQILCRVWEAHEPSTENAGVESATSLFQDMLYYVQDALDASEPSMAERLAVHLHQTFFRAVVLQGLTEAVGDHRVDEPPLIEVDKGPEVQLALYALCQLFLVTVHRPLLELVANDLLGASRCDSSRRTKDRKTQSNTDMSPAFDHSSRNGGPRTHVQASKVPEDLAKADMLGDKAVDRISSSSVETPEDMSRLPTREEKQIDSDRNKSSIGHGEADTVVDRGKGKCMSERSTHSAPRYRQSLIACLMQRQGGQVRLAAIATVRCLVRSVSVKDDDESPRQAEESKPAAVSASLQPTGCASPERVGCTAPLNTVQANDRGTKEVTVSGEVAELKEVHKTCTGRSAVFEGDGDGKDGGVKDEGEEARHSTLSETSPTSSRQVAPAQERNTRRKWDRSDGFVEVMLALLASLGQHPVSRTIDVQMAAAAVEELANLLSDGTLDVSLNASADVRQRKETAGVGTITGGKYSGKFGPWGSGATEGDRHLAVMLEAAYAASAGVLLGVTSRLHPFALLSALEQVLAAARVGIGFDAQSSHEAWVLPPTPLAEVAGWKLLLRKEQEIQLPTALIGASPSDKETIVWMEAYLVLRSLHEWLVEGRWSPLPPSPGPQHALARSPGSVQLRSDVLALAGELDSQQQPTEAPQTSRLSVAEDETQRAGVASAGASSSSEPRPDRALEDLRPPAPTRDRRGRGGSSHEAWGRVRLSGLRCVACCLPHNWPGLALGVQSVASTMGRASTFPASMERSGIGVVSDGHQYNQPLPGLILRPRAAGVAETVEEHPRMAAAPHPRSSVHEHPHPRGQSASRPGVHPPLPRDVYAVLDDDDFVLAAPDRRSADTGRVLSRARLRHTDARPLPADPRVLEIRVSTPGAEGPGPGVLLPVAGAGASEPSNGAGGPSFRGAGHRGLWHLVLVFETSAACALVAEHVEEQREAVVAARTVELVEMLRTSTEVGRSRSDAAKEDAVDHLGRL